MPAKRRRAKRRVDPAAELEAWRCWFAHGIAFDDDLDAVGAIDPVHARPGKARDKAMAVAREAWNRLGAAFLATFEPSADFPVPWAQQQFGDPQCP